MTMGEFQVLKVSGEKILLKLISQLNKVADEHIRLRKFGNYRRKEDLEEICVALALYDKDLQSRCPYCREPGTTHKCQCWNDD